MKKWVVVVIIIILAIIVYPRLKIGNPDKFASRIDEILPDNKHDFDFTRTILEFSSLIDEKMDIEWTEKQIINMLQLYYDRMNNSI